MEATINIEVLESALSDIVEMQEEAAETSKRIEEAEETLYGLEQNLSDLKIFVKDLCNQITDEEHLGPEKIGILTNMYDLLNAPGDDAEINKQILRDLTRLGGEMRNTDIKDVQSHTYRQILRDARRIVERHRQKGEKEGA